MRRASSRRDRDREQAIDAAQPGVPCGLVYVADTSPGIVRRRRGKGFSYHGLAGQPVRDGAELERIRRLAIPPAYTQVWICPLPQGHLQATGRDARGRKQYRYHAEFREARDAEKFARMLEFGQSLPSIRARVARDLATPLHPGVRRETVLATLVRLLDTTLVRVGNDEYARTNGSYGLTTLRNRHASVQGSTLRLRFRGKSGITHEVALSDPRVARVVRHCQALPGQELFQYVDEAGQTHCVGSLDVNEYLRRLSGADFTAKDFRTWHASSTALSLLLQGGAAAAAKGRINEVLAEVARRLRNTVAVCRKSYVHPELLDMARQGRLVALVAAAVSGCRARRGLAPEERRLLCLLSALRGTARRGGVNPARSCAPHGS